jgi:hypothetical protein
MVERVSHCQPPSFTICFQSQSVQYNIFRPENLRNHSRRGFLMFRFACPLQRGQDMFVRAVLKYSVPMSADILSAVYRISRIELAWSAKKSRFFSPLCCSSTDMPRFILRVTDILFFSIDTSKNVLRCQMRYIRRSTNQRTGTKISIA